MVSWMRALMPGYMDCCTLDDQEGQQVCMIDLSTFDVCCCKSSFFVICTTPFEKKMSAYYLCQQIIIIIIFKQGAISHKVVFRTALWRMLQLKK